MMYVRNFIGFEVLFISVIRISVKSHMVHLYSQYIDIRTQNLPIKDISDSRSDYWCISTCEVH